MPGYSGSGGGAATKGWDIAFTYFYVVYFAVLLIHRECRDDEACAEQYGGDWQKYKEIVEWRTVPLYLLVRLGVATEVHATTGTHQKQ